MPLEYDIDSTLKALAPVLDEHSEWFGRTTKRIFFPNEFKEREPLAVPESFSAWVKEAQGYDFIEDVTLDDLRQLFQELHIVGKGLTDKTKVLSEDSALTLAEYDNFVSLYENFLFKLRRLEQDCAMVDSGLDIESALRSRKSMEIDIGRELERRARRGNPFTLALARVDNYSEFKDLIDREQHAKVIGTLGRLIKKCIRSFDDAYRSGECEFIMCLKHSETVGRTAAVNRLRSFMADENILIKADGREIALTMSYCVAEPIPGDTLDDLLKNMRLDLDNWDESGDTALEYHEKSPLQRYIGEAD